MTRTRRRHSAALLVAALVGTLLATVLPGSATAAFSFTRFAGNDRYDTARLVATSSFGTSDVVVLTSGTSFPDALAGSYAAGLAGVPILLTGRDSLPAATSTALSSLKATKALIVGGTAAVGAGVVSALSAQGISTSRLAGATRYETSKLVAESGGAGSVGRSGATSQPTAVVASGESFPDALSAGPMGYAAHFPIILTTAAGLSPEAKAALTDLGIRNVLIVGGTAAVSGATEASIVTMGITVTRLAGNDRTETATKVADHEVANLGFVNTHVDLARGDDFADALAGAAHSGKAKSPALLTSNATTLGAATKAWLTSHASTLTSGHIDGGTGAVSSAVEAEATNAAKTPTSSTTTTTAPGLPTIPTTLPPAPTLTPCPAGQEGPGQPFCFTPPAPPSGTTTTITLPTTSTTAPPAAPAFASATTANLSPIITVTYDQPLNCTTVDTDGSDYRISVTAGPATGTNVQPAVAVCAGSVVTLTLGSGNFQTGQTGKVTAQAGTDGDTVKNLTGQAQAAGDNVTYTL